MPDAPLARRVAAAWKAAVGIFSDRSSEEAFGLLRGIWPGGVGAPVARGARERIKAYADMPWLHAIADKVAYGMASVDWTLYAVRPRDAGGRAVRVKALQRAGEPARRPALRALADAGELEAVGEHPLTDLLDAGNDVLTGHGVRKTTFLHWDLEGEAFWLKERDGLGVPVRVWPIPPDWVRALPTPFRRAYWVGFRSWYGWIPETEVFHLPSPNPSNPYGRGTGMAQALADELETDEYAARFTRQTFLNQNRPDYVVYPKAGETWQPAQVQALEAQWRSEHEGFWRAFRARFSPRELGVYEFKEQNFRNLQMIQLREFERDLIRQTWGVPPEIMGIVAPGSSRATIAKASYVFARWVLVPRLEQFRALLQERLVPEYDDRLVIEYNSPVEEDDEFALAAAKEAPWAFSADDWRDFAGRAPLADGRGIDLFAVPVAVTLQDLVPGPAPVGAPPDLAADERATLRRLAARAAVRKTTGGGGPR